MYAGHIMRDVGDRGSLSTTCRIKINGKFYSSFNLPETTFLLSCGKYNREIFLRLALIDAF